MASMKEIRSRMKSVQETQKITGAMYRVASAKLRHAKAELDRTRPYFHALGLEIKRIFRTVEHSDSRYFYPENDAVLADGVCGYLVITSDKGLAGAYNQNVLKQAEKLITARPDSKVFLVGDYGRRFFATHNIPVEQSFFYAAQVPSFERAREIAAVLLDYFDSGNIQKLFIVYTDFESGLSSRPKTASLLPLHHEHFEGKGEWAVKTPFTFLPSPDRVLESLIPGYVAGYIYSAIVDSFCCEQNARMTAMDSANRNAEKLLEELRVAFNHERQNRITREITEIAAGARFHQQQKEVSSHDR